MYYYYAGNVQSKSFHVDTKIWGGDVQSWVKEIIGAASDSWLYRCAAEDRRTHSLLYSLRNDVFITALRPIYKDKFLSVWQSGMAATPRANVSINIGRKWHSDLHLMDNTFIPQVYLSQHGTRIDSTISPRVWWLVTWCTLTAATHWVQYNWWQTWECLMNERTSI